MRGRRFPLSANFKNILGSDFETDSEEEEPEPNSIAAEEYAIRVYPDPASELLQVEHIPANGRFSMVNTEGKEVITRQGMKGNEQISISHLPAGAYIVTIYEQTAVVYRTTVVVQ